MTQYFWPESFRVNDLAAQLSKNGNSVTVLTGKPNYPGGAVFPSFKKTPSKYNKYSGADVLRVPHSARGRNSLSLILNYFSFAVSATIFGTWKLRGKRFDVIFAFQPSPVTVGLPAVWIRFFKKAPLIFWVQDLWPDTLQAVGVIKSKYAIKLIEKVVSYIYNRCDLILSQSKSFLPRIESLSHEGTKIRYFPNWAESFSDLNEQPKAIEISDSADYFNIIFTGNIGQAQDFPSILHAANLTREHQNIRWIIVGDGRMADWVRKEIERLQLSQTVIMLGRFPSARMPSFFSCADVLLVSLEDKQIYSSTIPSKIQTYLSSGVPILGMLNGEGADLINRSGSGFACPAGDYKGLAELAFNLSSLDPKQMKAIGLKGVKTYADEFDQDMLMQQLWKFMTELKAKSKLTSKQLKIQD